MRTNTHVMPFGAAITPAGVEFRLWAPGARQVDLCLMRGGEETRVPMEPGDEGWVRVETAHAGPGTAYNYLIDGQIHVPDPASRYQPEDVHGPSEVVDPAAWTWQDAGWRGRDWVEACIYELHVGTFTPAGTFDGVRQRLDHLAELGVTAIELMPVGDFPGRHSWGYDGVLPFAPDCRYGRPEELKALVDTAHQRGLMVFLDVVYNHFGPEGNYLHHYAPEFFTDRYHTPWGAAINFDGEHSYWVRQFFIHNALYWLEEFHFDGLRLDAVHAIYDATQPDILEELAEAVHTGPGAQRQIHLVLENDDNAAHYLQRFDQAPRWYAAQWNDDIHHALHVQLTGETSGYYADYADNPVGELGRCLTEGFAYQGERSPYRDGRPRGEPSGHLPPSAFVSFLQNHDQIGNRAFGERITALASIPAVRAAVSVLLLAPMPPLLFMGEEWGATQPFPYFCDFGPDLAEAVAAGRRREFTRFPEFRDEDTLAALPDPNDPASYQSALLDWAARDRTEHQQWQMLYRHLLALRRARIVPLLKQTAAFALEPRRFGRAGLHVGWRLGSVRLQLRSNLGNEPAAPAMATHDEEIVFSTHEPAPLETLPPWCVVWSLGELSTQQ